MFAAGLFVLWAVLSVIPLEYNNRKIPWLARLLAMPLIAVVLVPFLAFSLFVAVPYMVVMRRKALTIGRMTFTAKWK